MIRIFNISFTRAGNFSRLYTCIRLLVLVSITWGSLSCRAVAKAGTVDSLAHDFKKTDDAENFIYACVDLYLAAPTEDRLPVFAQYERNIWRPLTTAAEQLAYVILLCNKGFYLSQFGNIYQAAGAYEKAWQLFRDHRLAGLDIIEYCLKPLGNNYSMLGDYTSAAGIVRTYLFLAEQEENYAHMAGAAVNLSIIYHNTGNYQAAIALLASTLDIKEIPPEKKGLLYSGLARNYKTLGEAAQAGRFARLSIRFFEQYRDRDTPVHLAGSYKLLSLVSLHEKDTAGALLLFKKAHTIAAENSAVFKARELAKLSIEYGGLLKLKGAYGPALQAYRQALKMLLPGYSAQHEETLPDTASFYAENAIKESLDGLADLYEKLEEPLKAVACYERCFVVEDLLRATYHYQSAKLLQQVENRNRADRTIRLLTRLGNETHDPQYALRAFQVAERTKAITLKEMAEDRYARRLITHDSLLQRQSQLLFKQAALASELVLAQRRQPVADAERVRGLITRQSQLAMEIKSVRQAIRKKYPQYASTGRAAWLDIGPVQQKLAQDGAVLVEYFAGRDALFQFVLTADSLSLTKIDDIEAIDQSVLLLGDLFADAAAINNRIDTYKEIAFTLFRRLGLDKAAAQKKLVLIPDGLLHIIPFDALLYEEAAGTRYAGFPYLTKKHTIAYQPSALLYAHYREPAATADGKDLLALFPVFENTPQSLDYSLDEAENMRRYFAKGNYLLKAQATKRAFLENASGYNIIHLSTHAMPGDADEPPAIHFRDSVLHLPQIYGLQLQADLMVLSACETGVGRLAKGEGALSLAHGFQFAGARNVILSLWKVNDRSTTTLLSGFYKHYLNTGQKAEALQQARLDYLASEDIQNSHKAPYYWAAFIYYGDYDTVKEASNAFYGWLVAAAGGVMVLVVMVMRRKKRRGHNKIKKF